jgi:hypothetical protein
MPHTVESLAELNYKRFERRISWIQVVNREVDCWIWFSTLMGRARMPIFQCQDLTGRQFNVYARRFAWDHEFPWWKLKKGQILYHCCPNNEERCVSPYHHKREQDLANPELKPPSSGLRIKVIP